MEISSDCEPYLKSTEVINLLNQPNTLMHSKVFDCIRKYKNYFFSIVPLKHAAIPHDILLLIAEDVFSETESIFFNDVTNGKFKPVTEYCYRFFQVIFKRTYLKQYIHEVKRKKAVAGLISRNNTTTDNFDNDLNEADPIALKVQEIINTLSNEDKETYELVYIKQLSTAELCKALNITSRSLANRKYRFHTRFAEALKNYNKK